MLWNYRTQNRASSEEGASMQEDTAPAHSQSHLPPDSIGQGTTSPQICNTKRVTRSNPVVCVVAGLCMAQSEEAIAIRH